MKKIIFLDIDGVLNSQKYNRTRYAEERKDDTLHSYFLRQVDLNALNLLKEIINATGAKVAISSTWRLNHYEELLEIFENNDLSNVIIDKTPIGGCARGCEIHQWIRDNVEYLEIPSASLYRNYLIIDDDSDMLLWQKDNFVQTNNKFGLTQNEVKKSIEILNQT